MWKLVIGIISLFFTLFYTIFFNSNKISADTCLICITLEFGLIAMGMDDLQKWKSKKKK